MRGSKSGKTGQIDDYQNKTQSNYQGREVEGIWSQDHIFCFVIFDSVALLLTLLNDNHKFILVWLAVKYEAAGM